MYLEGIMLSEIRLRKTHAGWYHLYVDSKKAELVITRGWGGVGEAELRKYQTVQIHN